MTKNSINETVDALRLLAKEVHFPGSMALSTAMLDAANQLADIKSENEKIQKRLTKSEQERKWLTAKLLRAGCVVQPDGTFFLR